MRRAGLLAMALLALCLAACGSTLRSGGGQRAAATGAATSGARHNDRDDDKDHNDDDWRFLEYGHAATASDYRAIATLVRRYFAAAATQNGSQACSMLVPFLAEAVVEDYAHTPSAGTTCGAVMSNLFRSRHTSLAGKNAALHLLRIRVQGDTSLALIDFTNIHEVRQIVLRRYRGSWKTLRVLDELIE